MLQELLALILFMLAVLYSIYSLARLFISNDDPSTRLACNGCGGTCKLSSSLKTSNQ